MAKVAVTINGVSGEVEEGKTLLEASEDLGVSVAHYCFGNAICSTCRVNVVAGAENLSPQETKEKVSLNYHFCFDEKVRLCCQTRVKGPGQVIVAAPKLFKMIAPPKFGK